MRLPQKTIYDLTNLQEFIEVGRFAKIAIGRELFGGLPILWSI